ncbi:MAG: hypothetical protein K6B52_07365 [Clostridiales bacterium]|nr:hypothetical protein [Clostridiales bacterium]
MKENPLLKYAEQLAVQIDVLCKTLKSKENANASINEETFKKNRNLCGSIQ